MVRINRHVRHFLIRNLSRFAEIFLGLEGEKSLGSNVIVDSCDEDMTVDPFQPSSPSLSNPKFIAVRRDFSRFRR